MPAPQLLIAEDESLLRDQLREGLQTLWPEARICAQAADGNDALAALAEHRPDVAFLDIRMPHVCGLELAQRAPCATRIAYDACFGEVVSAQADARVFEGGRWSFRDDNTELHTLHHLGGGQFAWPQRSVQARLLT